MKVAAKNFIKGVLKSRGLKLVREEQENAKNTDLLVTGIPGCFRKKSANDCIT